MEKVPQSPSQSPNSPQWILNDAFEWKDISQANDPDPMLGEKRKAKQSLDRSQISQASEMEVVPQSSSQSPNSPQWVLNEDFE